MLVALSDGFVDFTSKVNGCIGEGQVDKGMVSWLSFGLIIHSLEKRIPQDFECMYMVQKLPNKTSWLSYSSSILPPLEKS